MIRKSTSAMYPSPIVHTLSVEGDLGRNSHNSHNSHNSRHFDGHHSRSRLGHDLGISDIEDFPTISNESKEPRKTVFERVLSTFGRMAPGGMRGARITHAHVPVRFFSRPSSFFPPLAKEMPEGEKSEGEKSEGEKLEGFSSHRRKNTSREVRIALISDLHLAWPWTTLDDLDSVLIEIIAARPDIVVIVGDHEGLGLPFARPVDLVAAARAICSLRPPLGVFATLGNHDWRDDPVAKLCASPPRAQRLLEEGGVTVLRNETHLIHTSFGAFWLAGLDDQRVCPAEDNKPFADIGKTLEPTLGDSLPVVLLAHEPDIFADLGYFSRHVGLTLSGHMHAGQVRIGDFVPGPIPSLHGKRFLHGIFDEGGRRMVVSSGLGYSGIPVRFGARPEVVMLDVEIV